MLLTACCAAEAQGFDLREAARLDSQGKCAEAEPHYQRALAAGTPSAALLNNAGNHYLLCGDPAKARHYFEKLLAVNPSHANARLQLARFALDEGQGAKALEHLEHIQARGPAVALLRAEALASTGRKEAAQQALEPLRQRVAADPALGFALGSLYARLGAYSQAEQIFHALLIERPGDFDLLLSLGKAAARAGHYDRARAALETTLKIRPGDVEALAELGFAHAAAGDSSRAVYLLAQARQQAPRRPDILLALARAAEDAGYYGDSALAYDDYLRLEPADETARRDRARVLGLTGTRLEEGLAGMAAYIAKHPQDPVGHFHLAQFTWRTEPEKSLEQLATAVRLDPRFAPAHVARAWLLHRLGRSSEAVPHLEAALEVAPDNVRALDQFSLVYLSLDRPAEAEAALRRALAVAPEDPEVLLHLGRALMALDRQEEAQQFLASYRKARPQRFRAPRSEPGMIESATLPEGERRSREIERLGSLARARPDDPLLQLHLAALLAADGRTGEADAAFRRLLAMNADAATLEQAGRALLDAEEHELARVFLERAAAERPEARLDLAIALFHTAGPGAALEVLERAPASGDALLLRARLLDAAGRSEEARTLLADQLSGTGLRPDLAPQAALLLARYGHRNEALDLLDRAARTGPGHPEIALTRALLLALADRAAEAEKGLESIQSRWPEWDRPYLAHALLLEQAGRPKPALEKLRTARALGSRDPALDCALARLDSGPTAAGCDCLQAFDRWVLSSCPAP